MRIVRRDLVPHGPGSVKVLTLLSTKLFLKLKFSITFGNIKKKKKKN